MNKILYLLAGLILLSGCAVTNESGTARLESRKMKKMADMAMIRKAVESRQYIIKLDKIYATGGSWADLQPRNNLIIIDGEIASVSLGYIGRSYGSRPISGINFNGHTMGYKLSSDEIKGMYDIEVRVQKGNDRFDFYMSIGSSGNCSVTVNNNYIQSVSYRGSVVPITRIMQPIAGH